MKKYFLFLVILAAPLSSFAAISLDNTSSAGAACFNTSSCSFQHTISAANEIIVVSVGQNTLSSANPISAITYAGQAMTLVAHVNNPNGSNNYAVEMYYLVNPPIGQNTTSITFSTTAYGNAGAASFSGVNTTTPISVNNTASGESGNPTRSLTTTQENQRVVDAVHQDGAPTNLTAGSSQTETLNLTNAGQTTGASYKDATATSSVIMSWTSSAGNDWVSIAAALVPIVEAGGETPSGTSTLSENAFSETCETNGTTTICYKPLNAFLGYTAIVSLFGFIIYLAAKLI